MARHDAAIGTEKEGGHRLRCGRKDKKLVHVKFQLYLRHLEEDICKTRLWTQISGASGGSQ